MSPKLTSSIPSGAVTRFRLNNGATLLVKEEPMAPVVALNFWIEAGSIDEKADERGMAHLIEHMIFKGTPKRGVGEISRQVEAAGGYLNAFTSYEHTCFFVVLPGEQVQTAMDIQFDAYLNSTFDKEELAKEKEVVFEEMRMRRDDPWSWSWEILFGLLYQKNPYHWPVIGDLKILKSVPRERLQAYYRKHYVPSNTVISVVGNVKAPQVLQWVEKQWRGVQSPRHPERHFKDDIEPAGLKVRWETGEVQQIYLSLGFPAVQLDHPDSAALEILTSLLGDGASSRFNLALREKTQSADEVACENFLGKFGGAIVFQALTDQKRLESCLKDLGRETSRLLDHPIPTEELEKVKNRIRSAKVFEKQSMDGQAKSLGFWELQGGYEKEEAFLKALAAVTPHDLVRVGRDYLKASRASLVIYHPKGQKPTGSPKIWEELLDKALSPPAPAKKKTKKSDDLRRFTLSNGDSLWVKPRKSLPLTSLGVFMPGGFSDEKEKNYGITSLLTKCLLKGTRILDYQTFSHRVESLAAHLDPAMDKDYWGLTLDCLEPQFKKAFDLFAETLWEPAFDKKEVAKETKMQLASIARLKDDPSDYALLKSDILTFQGTPYAHSPMGEPDTLKHLSLRILADWHKHFVTRIPRTWFAVGDLEAQALIEILESRIPSSRVLRGKVPIVEIPRRIESKTLRLHQGTQQSNLVLGMAAPAFHSPDYFPFRVLNTLLNGMGGRLFLELREKRSLAYSVYASHDAGARAGIYQIYIGCDPAKAEKARAEMERVLFSLWRGKITAEELDRAKTYMTGLFQMGLQSNRSQVMALARYEMTGRGAEWVAQVPGQFQKVTMADVRRVAEKYLNTEHKTWVLLDPVGSGPQKNGK